ncbi:alkyl sulfatase dimerization domain-containing protein [Rhodococcus sp. IEGM 1379]|uniref:alkyl/aryl-sulfatase n=1 Tax=Rhodococcus sp. IEGM 1379 TaxID=3047086 RepID=UPI0024B744C3|nr:alkyl sulfatase dimerization domain-containing protein [Rhodococcus sp. IEGM 1379]MDI9916062.1 alkyl sulfatase dimerization domain-containing protein [Rhodococcus sp. IEGM 1379]
MTVSAKPATSATKAANRIMLDCLDFEDRKSYDDARRGFIATLEPLVIKDEDQRVVWDIDRYKFLETEAPDTVNPSLWRMSQLHMMHGLFKVIDGIYQVRGFDISNMTVIEGDSGYVIVDPLTSSECAAAAMNLVYQELGRRPIKAIIYTHSHVDHFGGVKGIVSEDDIRSGSLRIVAPTGFLEHTVSENVYAGNAMNRRAQYMYGNTLPHGTTGMVSAGLGLGLSSGTVTLLEPTDFIAETGQQLTLDGVRIEFQYTPDSEAPAEMNFYLPDFRALCMAENVSHHMHNLYTPRGAQIRDAAAWSDYIHEALQLYGERSDVLFICHHWPVWSKQELAGFLERQRDLYRYIHDETLRLAAHGYTMIEIAEMIELPEELAVCWSSRGYYGSLNHNAKAVYQKYLGWFDGNPATLHPHPPVESGRRYVACMGGADAVLRSARESFDEGDYRWVAQVVNHVIFADPDNEQARELQADALEQLGYQSESAPWRNFYLTGAQELRQSVKKDEASLTTSDVLSVMTTDMMLNYLAIRLNGPKAAGRLFSVDLHVIDTRERRLVQLTNGVLVRTATQQPAEADVSIELTRVAFGALTLGSSSLGESIAQGAVSIVGDVDGLHELFSLLDTFERSFNIVRP